MRSPSTAALAHVYEQIAHAHNDLGLTEPLDESTRYYFERPFLVIGGDRFAAALASGLRGTDCEDLPLIGNIDQFVENTASGGHSPLSIPAAVYQVASVHRATAASASSRVKAAAYKLFRRAWRPVPLPVDDAREARPTPTCCGDDAEEPYWLRFS